MYTESNYAGPATLKSDCMNVWNVVGMCSEGIARHSSEGDKMWPNLYTREIENNLIVIDRCRVTHLDT